MKDASEASSETAPWLLLLHQLPPKPDYLRVKIRRRLAGTRRRAGQEQRVRAARTPTKRSRTFSGCGRRSNGRGRGALIAEAGVRRGNLRRGDRRPCSWRSEPMPPTTLTGRFRTPDRVGPANVGDAAGRVRRPDRERVAHPAVHRSARALQVRGGAAVQAGEGRAALRHGRGGVHARRRGLHVPNTTHAAFGSTTARWRQSERSSTTSIARTRSTAARRPRACWACCAALPGGSRR